MNFRLLICLLILFSCNKEKFEVDFTNGKAEAIKNDEQWVGQGYGFENNKGIGYDFFFDVFNNSGELRHRLSFQKIPKEIGMYSLFNVSGQSSDSIAGCSYNTSSFDGDVIEDVYRVLEDGDESTITISDYSESLNTLSGSFKLKLFIDPVRPRSNSNNPDTLVFEEGIFEVVVQ